MKLQLSVYKIIMFSTKNMWNFEANGDKITTKLVTKLKLMGVNFNVSLVVQSILYLHFDLFFHSNTYETLLIFSALKKPKRFIETKTEAKHLF